MSGRLGAPERTSGTPIEGTWRWALALCSAALLAGCGEDVTQMVVIVDSDLSSPDELDEVAFHIRETEEEVNLSVPFAGTGADLELPLTLTLTPRDDPALHFKLQVVGLLDGEPQVERTARVSFVPGQSLQMRMDLRRVCVDSTCADTGDTCVLGTCRSPDAQDTPPFDGLDPARTEVCNGMDDDEDGVTDEGDGATLCGEPAATRAVQCITGTCEITDCEPGQADCDGVFDNGCEVDPDTDPRNCGMCGMVCPWGCAGGGCDAPEQLALGRSHSCALTAGGALYCWGSNEFGQVGAPGASAGPDAPDLGMTRVLDGVADVVDVAAGAFHTCAIDEGGALWCWGRNDTGQLGLATDQPFVGSPTQVPMTGSAVAVDASVGHTCVATAGGDVVCWGDNSSMQLGLTGGSTDVPDGPVVGLAGAWDVAVGAAHTCAIDEVGDVQCWGSDELAQLGRGSAPTPPTPTPRPVARLHDVVSISAGDATTCAVSTDRTGSPDILQCWGANTEGEAAVGNTELQPVVVPAEGRFTHIAMGAVHACGVDGEGLVECWGRGAAGQLGRGAAMGDPTSPARTMPSIRASAIAAGGEHSCALDDTGGLWCWGSNAHRQLGIDGGSAPTPRLVAPPSP